MSLYINVFLVRLIIPLVVARIEIIIEEPKCLTNFLGWVLPIYHVEEKKLFDRFVWMVMIVKE